LFNLIDIDYANVLTIYGRRLIADRLSQQSTKVQKFRLGKLIVDMEPRLAEMTQQSTKLLLTSAATLLLYECLCSEPSLTIPTQTGVQKPRIDATNNGALDQLIVELQLVAEIQYPPSSTLHPTS
jgi:hypothetical protein